MENINIWINIIISILTGLATAIPLVIKLVAVVKEAVQAKNWTPLMQLVFKLMGEAEQNYSDGSEKKKYVMDSIRAVQDTLNYPVDMNAVSEMIDSIIDVTKKVNVKAPKKKSTTK